jgi:hypothetical protein
MKNKNFNKSVIATAIVLSMSVFFLAGCQSKPAAATTDNGTSQTAATKPSADAMKKQMQANIKPLVDNKTITQAQADTIITTMTANTGKGFGSRTTGQNGANSSQSKGTATKPSGQAPVANGQGGTNRTTGSGQNRTGFNPLSKLVTDKTITQAQADAVMKVIRNGIGRQGGNKNGQTATQSTNQ